MNPVEADIREILYKWDTPKAARILEEMGVSERNWRLFALHSGTVDEHEWSYRALANLEERRGNNITHVRVYQIVKKTEMRLKQYVAKRGGG